LSEHDGNKTDEPKRIALEPDDVLGPDSPERRSGDKSEMVKIDERIPGRLFVLPHPELVLFPGMMAPLTFEEGPLLRIIEAARGHSEYLFFVHSDPETGHKPPPGKLARVGTTMHVLRKIQLPDGKVSLVVQGVRRSRPVRVVREEPFLVVDVEHLDEIITDTAQMEALAQALQNLVHKFAEEHPKVPQEIALAVLNIEGPGHLADFVASQFGMDPETQQQMLEELDVTARLRRALEHLTGEYQKLELSQRIQQEIQDKVEKHQKEFFLREQLKAIRKELGEEKDEKSLAADEYLERINAAKMPEEAEKRALEELDRFNLLSPESAEYNVIRTYLDWLCDLPWSKSSGRIVDVEGAQRVLDRDHYGLEEVKERIIEFLAVRKLKPDQHGPILCLAGPPGVGKTSLGRSVAEALGREFFRFSLGGMRDEAEIKGHRRTYVGAMPGKFLQALKRIGTNDPLMMLDEIDKVGSDWRGDPSSALLEVLDPAQNSSFLDHYLDVPFDLSKIFFITTANQLDTIPRPLLDRMEVINLPGYIVSEKVKIASRYLLPRQREENGLKASQVKISEATLKAIARGYTREAGVRNLEREIGKICRKVATGVAKGKVRKPVSVTLKNLSDYLGPAKIESELAVRPQPAGVAVGLAWTPFGGDILFIEASAMPGGGRFKLTGQLGEVMSESAQIAWSYVRGLASEFGVEMEQLKRHDFHVHFPAGAIPKDGPSAGITIVTALLSLLTGRSVPPRLAMTGEVTLVGNVLPVGGIREKVIAARDAGVKTLILPRRNEKDLQEVPPHLRKGIRFHFAETYDDVRKVVFGKNKDAQRKKRKRQR